MHCLFYWSKIKLPNWNKYHLSLLSCITETRLLKVISGTSILATSLLRLVNYLDCWIIFCWSQSRAPSQPAQIIWVCLDILVFQIYNRHLSDIWVICQSVNLKQERTEKGRSFSQRLVKWSLSSQIGLFIVCQRHGFIVQTYAFGIISFFLARLQWDEFTPFVAKLIMSRIRAFWDLFWHRYLGFYSDFTQISLRYLYKNWRPEALAEKTNNWRDKKNI